VLSITAFAARKMSVSLMMGVAVIVADPATNYHGLEGRRGPLSLRVPVARGASNTAGTGSARRRGHVGTCFTHSAASVLEDFELRVPAMGGREARLLTKEMPNA
jgi:hypothetical protein